MNYMTIQKNLGHSPRKLRLVADMVRGLNPFIALEQLKFTNKAAATDLAKAIKTALANAGNSEKVVFKSIEINEGLKMRRYRVGTAGRGRNRPYKKRLSHIKIVLTDEVVEERIEVLKDKNMKSENKEEKKGVEKNGSKD